MSLRVAISFPLSLGVPGGGTEDCRNLASHLRRAGAEPLVLCALSAGPGRYPRRPPSLVAFEEVRAELEREGIETIGVPAHPAHYLLDGRAMRRAVRALLERRSIDALLGWWHEAAFLPDLLASKRVVFAINAAASYALAFPAGRRHPLEALRRRFLIERPLRRAALVFVRSDFTRRELEAFARVPPERVRLVPCGVDPRFGALRRTPVGGPPLVLYFGRLTHEKGIFDALAALARLPASGPPAWKLRVAGWGDAEAVRTRARELGLEARIDFLGPLSRDELAQELARAELALLPSWSESFGLANAEALAAGVPVVAYAAGAVPEVVLDGETGWLAPARDVAGLASALASALADPAERAARGAAGRARVLERYTWERAARDTLAALEEAVAALRGGR